ncbi:hypothetical protein [Mesorhizobium sp. M1405]|uniref:hypothetical protein n=1 Tax=Mesorhizobium sp. M1405 TaxID=2957098 RepID=UPI00333949D8
MLLDETDIEQMNRVFLAADPYSHGNLLLCSKAIDFLRDTAKLPDLDTVDDIAHMRLGVRLINDAGAFGKCALAGYYQPALAMIRDIVEVGFLLEVFAHDRSRLVAWHNATDAERLRDWKPVKVREMLDKISPADKEGRKDAYKFLSTHGTHVSPNAVHLISPGNMTEVGPFPDKQRVALITFDIAKFLGYATAHFSKGVRSNGIIDSNRRLAFTASRVEFALAFVAWRQDAAKQSGPHTIS